MATSDGYDLKDVSVKLFFCVTCYKESKVYLLRKLRSGLTVSAWPYLSNITIDRDGSSSLSSLITSELIGLTDVSSSHNHPYTDPVRCDCLSANKAAVHEEILKCIAHMESLSDQLEFGHGVTAKTITRTATRKPIDSKVPRDGRLGLLKTLSKRVTVLFLGDEKIETKASRPLCTIYRTDTFNCHWSKMLHYAPANCNCTPTACCCTDCILCHVRHGAEDYENALRRIRLGVVKLHAASQSATTDATALLAHEPPSTAGCAMPGVPKAKHLKNYCKAFQDMHNHGRGFRAVGLTKGAKKLDITSSEDDSWTTRLDIGSTKRIP